MEASALVPCWVTATGRFAAELDVKGGLRGI
jgi:hypothetical protein